MTRRYPLEPLAAVMHRSVGSALAQLGVSGTTAKQYRLRGVSERVADRLACRAGFHPSEVWPEWLEHQLEDAETECAADDCVVRFVPNSDRHRFCSRSCVSRRWQRSKYRTDSDWREAEKEKRRQRYAECAEYEKARQRRYRNERGAA